MVFNGCISKSYKESKDAWKKRKEALEEVESACDKFKGLISTAPECFKPLAELTRGLKNRLSDSQSNLKPLAARIIASLLGSVDGPSQGKLGKIVYGSLIFAAMNDNKKMMRDAAMDALEKGSMNLELDGGGVNTYAMDSLITALISELEDSELKVRLF